MATQASAASPAPVVFHEACPFTVLAGTSIDNSSATAITGDVGSASQSGFASVSLTGTNHFNDATTMAAQGDLLNAYNDGAARLTTTTLATQLGGTTQNPGVFHSLAGTFALTGILTLDGGGDGNAVFIFKTDSSLITAANSSVSLTNGAQAKNVFWIVGSSVTLGATSVFKGSLLVNTAITLGAGVAVSGRLLVLGTSVVLDSDTVLSPGACTSPVPLGTAPESSSFRANHNVFDPRKENLLLSGRATSAGKLELEVYDLAGRLVRRLLAEERQAGPWTIAWDGRTDNGQWAASDVYLILLRMGGAQELHKVALVRD